jgi:hypothetical protein
MIKNRLRISILTALCLMFSVSVSSAQTVEELAQKYANMPQIEKMMDDMFSPEAMANQFAAGIPANVPITDEKKAKIGALLSEKLNEFRPRMKELMVESSAGTFSAEELSALIDFYGSKHGSSVMAKMQPFFQNVMTKMAPEMQAMQMGLMPEIIAIIQEE